MITCYMYLDAVKYSYNKETSYFNTKSGVASLNNLYFCHLLTSFSFVCFWDESLSTGDCEHFIALLGEEFKSGTFWKEQTSRVNFFREIQ